MMQPAPDRLAELAASLGEPPSGGDPLFRLAAKDVAWFVERGGVDVFLVEYRDGAVVSSFKHVLRAGAGPHGVRRRRSGRPGNPDRRGQGVAWNGIAPRPAECIAAARRW